MTRELRSRVRAVLAANPTTPVDDAWMRGLHPALSTALGHAGLLGTLIPEGRDAVGTHVERFAITEELLRAGAPCAAHWLAERQIGPVLARYASEELAAALLPRIRRGDLLVSVAISEPDAGSDVAAIRTRARRHPDGGWVVDGRKIWTTLADHAELLYVIVRTGSTEDPQQGLTELLIDRDAQGIEVRPIEDLAGQHHFAEIAFDGVRVPDDRVIGEVGAAWSQTMAQLDLERAGPERVLSSHPTLARFAAWVREDASVSSRQALGELAASATALRALARRVAVTQDLDHQVGPFAAAVKMLGGRHEQRVVDVAIDVSGATPRPDLPAETLAGSLGRAVVRAPVYTLRGGATEILATIIDRRGLASDRPTSPLGPDLAAPEAVAMRRDVQAMVHDRANEDPWAVAVEGGWLDAVAEAPDLAVEVVRAAGRAARATPLPVQVAAAHLLHHLGADPPEGRVVLAPTRTTEADPWCVQSVPWARDADRVLYVDPAGVVQSVSVVDSQVTRGLDAAGDPCDDLQVPPASARPVAELADSATADRIAGYWAAVAIAGLGRAALDQTVAHTGRREQFGRPLRRLQAVAHRQSDMAADVELVEAAVADLGPAPGPLLDVARSLASRVAVRVAAGAHQLHGAIGTTVEHPLWRATLRLRAAAAIGGGPRVAEVRLGRWVAEDVDGWWDLVSEALDRR